MPPSPEVIAEAPNATTRCRSPSWSAPSLAALFDAFESEAAVITALRAMSPSCCFCRARGISPDTGHTNKNCPEIARMRPCMKCGASGFANHTLKYCPKITWPSNSREGK
uniref:Nanos-type domain-containing protein n=1 Tax=Steinernema glaseri TaxID=37863 RepID=A0A1I7Z0X6_9BILA